MIRIFHFLPEILLGLPDIKKTKMEEQIKRIRLSVRLSALVVVITCASLVISHRLDTIRTVDFIQIFVGGTGFGVLLVNVLMLRKLKQK